MDKQYQHLQTEDQIYQLWEKNKAFTPKASKNKKDNYCVIMPPPNANDPLHIGHAMFISIEDILVRYNRMLGKATLWLPGTDHAGIETQFVFEKKLKKKGTSRFQFDRETLYKMIWDYVQENSEIAINQIKKLGASADWSRCKFTLDEDVVETVLNTFEDLNNKGLIYRANRLVNYCTKCGTAFSNLEVNHVEKEANLYYIKYGPFTLATTRPETKFADTGLAVHPDDKRYKKYIGESIKVSGLLGDFELKVIADDFVDPEFGTGVVKITPYHDHNDFECHLRHKSELPKPVQVIDLRGKLTKIAGKYKGLKAHIAREQIVKDLDSKGLLEKIDKNYKHNIGVCYRCGTVIEPLPLPQFYIKVKPLTKPAIEAVNKKQVSVVGAGHEKILLHWLKNLEDWNISRQIVWGIRMPIWYNFSDNPDIYITSLLNKSIKIEDNEKIQIKKLENHILVSGKISDVLKGGIAIENIKKGLQTLTAPIEAKFTVSTTCPGKKYIQETDTFDTWFSSGQWPFATLKNTEKNDFDSFYPTDVMETGYDILPFWVMRMLMLGLFKTKKIPFKTVYLHGLVRDSKGKKMSKSKGNVINPLEITEKYGADALRMALVIRSSPGLDKSVGIPEFKAMRNFANKIWNASRYILMNQNQSDSIKTNLKYHNKLDQIIAGVSNQLNKYRIGLAAETTYNEFWHWYCDKCIEGAKNNKISQKDLLKGLIVFLKLLHPFMPFVTESIWQELRKKNLTKKTLLIQANWPKA